MPVAATLLATLPAFGTRPPAARRKRRRPPCSASARLRTSRAEALHGGRAWELGRCQPLCLARPRLRSRAHPDGWLGTLAADVAAANRPAARVAPTLVVVRLLALDAGADALARPPAAE